METDNAIAGRRQRIATAISTELNRQRSDGFELDVEALAEAIDAALDAERPIAEGRRPDELNATNDD